MTFATVARLEREQPADAVVLVDDVVARAQIGERLERAAEARVGARRTLAEDLRVRQEREAELAPDEAAPRGLDDEREAGLLRQAARVVHDLRLDAAQHRLRTERLAAVREGDDHAQAGAHEAGELVLRLGQPARSDRRPLGLEGERLVLRERVEPCGGAELELSTELLACDLEHLVRLPDEVRRPIEQRHEVARRTLSPPVLVVRQRAARRGRAAARRPGRQPPRGRSGARAA